MPFHYSLCSLYWCHECVCGGGMVSLLLDSSESSDPPRGPLQHHPSIWEAGCPVTAREWGSPGSPQGFQLFPCCGEGGGKLVLPTSLLGLLWHHPGWQEASLSQPDEGAKLSSLHWAFTVRGVGGMICFWGRVGQYVRVLKRNRPIECVHGCVCVCVQVYVCVSVCMYQREIDLGNCLTIGGGWSEVCRVDWQTEDLGKNWCRNSSPQAVWRQNSLFLVGRRGWENTCFFIKVIN